MEAEFGGFEPSKMVDRSVRAAHIGRPIAVDQLLAWHIFQMRRQSNGEQPRVSSDRTFRF